jgi:hypothetical protein
VSSAELSVIFCPWGSHIEPRCELKNELNLMQVSRHRAKCEKTSHEMHV